MRCFVLQRDEDHTGVSGVGIVAEGECVLAFTMIDRHGYARVWDRTVKKTKLAHRVVWEQAHGPIPDGLCVCHRCDIRNCVNVQHLFLGTPGDNNRDRGIKGRSRNGRELRTHCPRGHEYTPENTALNRKGGRLCRECQRAADKEWYWTKGRELRRARRAAGPG